MNMETLLKIKLVSKKLQFIYYFRHIIVLFNPNIENLLKEYDSLKNYANQVKVMLDYLKVKRRRN